MRGTLIIYAHPETLRDGQSREGAEVPEHSSYRRQEMPADCWS
jgi:hypothetical protein